jgi:hypothetical protein
MNKVKKSIFLSHFLNLLHIILHIGLNLNLGRLRIRIQILTLIRQKVQPRFRQIRGIHQILHLFVGPLEPVLINEALDFVDGLVEVDLFGFGDLFGDGLDVAEPDVTLDVFGVRALDWVFFEEKPD